MARLIVENPFLLALLAAALAEVSALLLRRTAVIFGGWLRGISGGLSVFSSAGLIWSFYWALRQSSSIRFSPLPIHLVLGWSGILFGVSLVVWGAIVLRMRVLFVWSKASLETRPPYRHLRRPMGLGAALFGLGAGLVVGSSTMWTWYLAWMILAQCLFEIEEWELKTRLPDAADYLKRTPRYLPLFKAIFHKK